MYKQKNLMLSEENSGSLRQRKLLFFMLIGFSSIAFGLYMAFIYASANYMHNLEVVILVVMFVFALVGMFFLNKEISNRFKNMIPELHLLKGRLKLPILYTLFPVLNILLIISLFIKMEYLPRFIREASITKVRVGLVLPLLSIFIINFSASKQNILNLMDRSNLSSSSTSNLMGGNDLKDKLNQMLENESEINLEDLAEDNESISLLDSIKSFKLSKFSHPLAQTPILGYVIDTGSDLQKLKNIFYQSNPANMKESFSIYKNKVKPLQNKSVVCQAVSMHLVEFLATGKSSVLKREIASSMNKPQELMTQKDVTNIAKFFNRAFVNMKNIKKTLKTSLYFLSAENVMEVALFEVLNKIGGISVKTAIIETNNQLVKSLEPVDPGLANHMSEAFNKTTFKKSQMKSIFGYALNNFEMFKPKTESTAVQQIELKKELDEKLKNKHKAKHRR